jgi:CxxC motif-containing protein
MNNKELICIGCPVGCVLNVEILNNRVKDFSGNKCNKGKLYGQKECTNPTRIATSTVMVIGGKESVLPVKTDGEVPKEKLFNVINIMKNVKLEAPVSIGDIVVKDIFNTEINIVATKNIDKIS